MLVGTAIVVNGKKSSAQGLKFVLITFINQLSKHIRKKSVIFVDYLIKAQTNKSTA